MPTTAPLSFEQVRALTNWAIAVRLELDEGDDPVVDLRHSDEDSLLAMADAFAGIGSISPARVSMLRGR